MKKIGLFLMIAVCTVVLLAGCSKDKEDEPKSYTVSVASAGNGTASTDKTTAEAGTLITITALADNGYTFEKWTVESGGAQLSAETDNPATFTMPESNVSVRALFIQGIVINGLRWAYTNVNAPGTFAANPESTGLFYQWGRITGWSSTDPMTSSPAGSTWIKGHTEDEVWNPDLDPCPEGWSIPTNDQLSSLVEAGRTTHEWTTVNGIPGRIFSDSDSGNSIFLPAAGFRWSETGELRYVGEGGYYWSATMSSYSNANGLYFSNEEIDLRGSYQGFGNPIRCVAE